LKELKFHSNELAKLMGNIFDESYSPPDETGEKCYYSHS
jgi:hypothetical protein